jgi:hypothetical protein
VPALVEHLKMRLSGYASYFTVFVVAYCVLMTFTRGLAPEQLGISALWIVCALGNDRMRRFSDGMAPMLAFGILWDLTHFTEPLVAALRLHVHVLEPYRFDLRFLGVDTAAGRVTPSEFFLTHHWPWVDFITGTAYILFCYLPLGFAVYLSTFRPEPWAQRLMRHFGWTFFAMNLAGFATYYIYPTAPPWYVTQYGLGPINYGAHASAAAGLRWDALTGIPYFAGFYGRSADVFGAIPSLHVAYPLMVFLYARSLGHRWLDTFNLAFTATVAFAAIYLQHHYVLDVLIGAAYALVAYTIDRYFLPAANWIRRPASAKLPSSGLAIPTAPGRVGT